MRIRMGRRHLMLGMATTLLVGLVAAAVLAVGGITAWEYSNSNAFCTNMCHAVHPEEPKAHAQSSHGRVQCVECHMGRLGTLHLMALKMTHVNELWGMIVGYERPTHGHTMRPARDNCEGCHLPSLRHSDTVRLKFRYADDPKSTETRYKLTLHTGAGEAREGNSKGIHWHVAQDMTYGALDAQKQKIPWIQVKDADGKVRTWFDATDGVSRQDADKLPKQRLECADCHNAVGHPFANPADSVDHAIQEGAIDRSLPSIKARALAIIAAATPEVVAGDEQARGAIIDKLIADAAPKGEMKPEVKAAEASFAKEMRRILLTTSFAAKGISWKSFPDNAGHKNFPGCFRCHDGKHLDAKGEAIRLQCTLCHALPEVVREDGARTVASTVSPDLEPPPSHAEPNFMHDHRSKMDSTCTMCHGPIKFGKDGGAFCSNPACHGRKWPNMNLDAEAAPPNKAALAVPLPAAPAGGERVAAAAR
ncbi:MAG: NapC/NirT family cytochrome c [Betaproteobacteria bacterium]|nr:NapC/NirT family cytochrome c [Betaproteobacteria bacterium]